jgi:hypothetical protein
MECCFCKKTYLNQQVLKHHKATSKKCIIIQKEVNAEVQHEIYSCSFCKKELTTKNRLSTHLVICKKKIREDSLVKNKKIERQTNQLKEEMVDKFEQLASDFRNQQEEHRYELKQKEEKIKELEDKLQQKNKTPPKITNKITNKNKIETNIETQNNHITIYQIMTPEHVDSFFRKHYNLDTLLGGQKALARFVNDGFLKEAEEPLYLCGDRSRQKFYIVKDGKKMEDTDCNEIIGLTSAGMPHVQDVYETALFSNLPEQVTEEDVQDNYDKIMIIDEQRSDFKSELSKIISSEVPEHKHDIKAMVTAMKERSKRLGLLERNNKYTEATNKDTEYTEELIRRPDILGVSPGKLMVYRDRYRKDGTIKGPASIMIQIESNEDSKREYLTYLQS